MRGAMSEWESGSRLEESDLQALSRGSNELLGLYMVQYMNEPADYAHLLAAARHCKARPLTDALEG